MRASAAAPAAGAARASARSGGAMNAPRRMGAEEGSPLPAVLLPRQEDGHDRDRERGRKAGAPDQHEGAASGLFPPFADLACEDAAEPAVRNRERDQKRDEADLQEQQPAEARVEEHVRVERVPVFGDGDARRDRERKRSPADRPPATAEVAEQLAAKRARLSLRDGHGHERERDDTTHPDGR